MTQKRLITKKCHEIISTVFKGHTSLKKCSTNTGKNYVRLQWNSSSKEQFDVSDSKLEMKNK